MTILIHPHLDLAEFLLDLVRHLIGPVLFPEKVPEDSSHQGIYPTGLFLCGTSSCPGTYTGLRCSFKVRGELFTVDLQRSINKE